MVCFLSLFQQVFLIKQYFLELTLAVHLSLVKEMRRLLITALPPRQQGPGFYLFSKFNSTDKAVSVYAISFLNALEPLTDIRREHPPGRRNKTYRKAWLLIVIMIIQI